MCKKVLRTAILLIFALLLAMSVLANEVTVGGENGIYATVEDALTALNGKGGTVVINGNVEVGNVTVPEQEGDLYFRAENGGYLVLDGVLTLAKNENSNNVSFDLPITVGANGAKIFGGFNNVHFTNNFVVNGTVDFFGGVNAPVGDYELSTSIEQSKKVNIQTITDIPYEIVVDNGNFGVFMGGNYREEYASVIGSVAEITITINGGTFTSPVSYSVNDALKINPAFSVSGMSFITDKTTLNINGGVFNTPIYVQAYIGTTGTKPSNTAYYLKTDSKYYAADGDVTVAINGGTFGKDCIEISAEQTAASYNRVLRGNFDVTVSSNAKFNTNTVFDATQVKAYENSDAKATLVAEQTVSYKRFDVVNGKVETYDEPIRIACVGDSITQGTGSSVFATYSYPAQLYKLIVENQPSQDVIVSNYGCASCKVMNHDGRWYNSGLAYVLSQKETDADYIVVGLGTNDVRATNYSVGQAQIFTEVYEELIDSYEKLPSTKKVFGTTAIYRRGTEGLDIGSTCVIRPLQTAVLNRETELGKRVCVDLYALLLDSALGGKLLGSDMLHPNKAGYTIYAKAIYDAIFNGVYAPSNFEMDEIYVAAGAPNTAAGTKDDPIGDIIVALGKASANATIYVQGTYEHTRIKFVAKNPFATPYGKNITFKGDGEDAVLAINSKVMYANGDLKFDNITLDNCYNSEAIHIALGYHNAEFTNTFKSNDGIQLNAGFMVYSDDPAIPRYTSAEAVSSDKDCTITVNGGNFVSIIGGNFHYPNANASYTDMPNSKYAEWGSTAPYGTYSGTMNLNIGKDVDFGSCTHKNKEGKYLLAGIVGMNYLTGTINANIASWGADVPIRDYALIGTYSSHRDDYDESNNTGAVNINVTDIENEVIITGDFDKNGTFSVSDVLHMLTMFLDDGNGYDSRYFYDREELSLVNVIRGLIKVVN